MRRRFSKDVYDWFKSFAESLTNDFTRQAEIVKDMQEALDEDFPVKRKTYRHRSARDILYIFICRYAWDTPYEHIGLSLVPPITSKNTNWYCNWAESYFLKERNQV